jgi:hypothetical protein
MCWGCNNITIWVDSPGNVERRLRRQFVVTAERSVYIIAFQCLFFLVVWPWFVAFFSKMREQRGEGRPGYNFVPFQSQVPL